MCASIEDQTSYPTIHSPPIHKHRSKRRQDPAMADKIVELYRIIGENKRAMKEQERIKSDHAGQPLKTRVR